VGLLSLTPGLAAALGVLALAIVASYVLKPRQPRRRVSSTLLWLAALHEADAQRPWRRLPPSALLLLQLVALGAIVAAVARPYLLSRDATGTDAVVLLDVSASMQATDVTPSRFDVARRRVAEMIDALPSDSALTLVSLGAEPRVVAPRTGDRTLLRQALAGLRPTTRAANLAAGLSLAASLAEGHPGSRLIVVGDGSLNRSQQPASLPLPVRYVPIGVPAENLAIAGFGTRGADGALAALAHVTNYGAQPRVARIELRVDGVLFDASTLSLEPGGSADARWDDLPQSARVLEARLVDDDALALDNRAWSVVGDDRPTRILLVSEANVFLERALALRPGAEVTRRTPAAYTTQLDGAGPYDLSVFDGFVPAALPQGGSALLLHPPAGNSLIGAHDDVAVSRLDALRDDHPVLAGVPLAGVHVARARRLDVPLWADAVLGSPETPLLVVGEQAGHRLAVLGFDVHASDLPLQPAFPVLVHNLLDWLVPASSVATPVVGVGESAALVPLPDAQSVEVLTPDGQRIPAAPPFPAQPFGDTDAPGVYQVVQRDARGRETRSTFAVNFVSERESRLEPGQADDGRPETAAGASGAVSSASPGAPREVWEGVALLALALLTVEWWAYHHQ